MRKLCPNFDREDGLETVLEVPIPEEMFASSGGSAARSQQAVASWLRSQACGGPGASAPLAGRNAELQLLLNVVGSPLVPFPVPADPTDGTSIRNCSSIVSPSCAFIDRRFTQKNRRKQDRDGLFPQRRRYLSWDPLFSSSSFIVLKKKKDLTGWKSMGVLDYDASFFGQQ